MTRMSTGSFLVTTSISSAGLVPEGESDMHSQVTVYLSRKSYRDDAVAVSHDRQRLLRRVRAHERRDFW